MADIGLFGRRLTRGARARLIASAHWLVVVVGLAGLAALAVLAA